MRKYTLNRYGTTPKYILAGKSARKIYESVIEFFTVPKLHESFRHLPFSGQAMQKLLQDYEFTSVLDIGSGEGLHANILKNHKQINERINKISLKLKRRVKLLIGKPGLDGHSSGAEQISVSARDVGMEVVYQGIRLTPEQIVNTAIEESVHMIALSILSGSHLSLTQEIIKLLKKNKISNIPLVVGGIITREDEKKMLKLGVSRIYTPKNYDVNSIMSDFANILEKHYL